MSGVQDERRMEPRSWDPTLHDKNDDIGGTWYENNYPGCACSVPAHIYTFIWEPNLGWSTCYAYGPVILECFQKLADANKLRKYVNVRSQVQSTEWRPAKGIYNLVLKDPHTGREWHDWSQVLVNAI
jgi:cation diffusion facilitator CzcD-associated flavoprotein CzcO